MYNFQKHMNKVVVKDAKRLRILFANLAAATCTIPVFY